MYSQKTKAETETGNTIEYDVKSYQVNQTIVKSAIHACPSHAS